VTQYQPEQDVSGWAIGAISFAAALLIVAGTFQALEGLAAIINDKFFLVTRNYAFDLDVSAWGWIHLIIGVLLVVVGFGLFRRSAWAGVTALILAMISAISNFFTIPYYPWWSLLIIAIDIWVIWALTRPGAIQT
jgi:hypothetical protein